MNIDESNRYTKLFRPANIVKFLKKSLMGWTGSSTGKKTAVESKRTEEMTNFINIDVNIQNPEESIEIIRKCTQSK